MSVSGETHRLRCACGAVECAAQGSPIGTAVCYCDDCQKAGHEIEALPGASQVLDPDSGTGLTLFRANRFSVTRGSEELTAHKLNANSATSRMVASCCNSAMYLAFDRGPHWVSTFRNRFVGEQPPIGYRLMTKYRTSPMPYLDDVPTYPKFPMGFLWLVLRDWASMKLGR
jgi:hypothetical protein